MVDVVDNGMTLVYWVPEIADISAPTASEIEDGIRLSGLMTADGLEGFDPATGEVDTTSIESKFGTTMPGRPTFSSLGLMLKKQQGTDEAHETLRRGEQGNVVVRRYQDSEDPIASGDEVEVYPVTCGDKAPQNPDGDGNSPARYRIPLFLHSQPDQYAEVAGN